MDQYIPPELSDTEQGSRFLLQIAEYLSERGIAVLRYNKRGIGLKGSILDENVVVNTTYQDLQQDAEKALEVLIQQPEVDEDDITILGHSEGTFIAPRIAIKNPEIKKIVLMSAAAHNLYDILYFQLVEQGINQFNTIDSNNDGLLSVQEVYVLPSVMKDSLIENSTGEWRWYPGIDPNGDGYISLIEERIPLWNQTFAYLTTAEYPGSKWMQSHFPLERNLDIIEDVPASILILQAEGDTQTPVTEAFLLEQRLTEVGNPDHTLITYPGLGHSFYLRDGFLQWLGPIQDYVLSDLVSWLKDPDRDVHHLETQLETANAMIADLQGQLEDDHAAVSRLESQMEGLQSQFDDEQTKINMLDDKVSGLEGENVDLQDALSFSRNLNYIAIGIAVIAAVMTVLAYQRRSA
jgi:dienelactone hydrolase